MSCSSCLLLLFFGYTSAGVTYYLNGQPKRNPQEFQGLLSMNQLAIAGGYPATNYEVITEDGYSLWLFRLGSNSGPPVLIQHGIGLAGDQWVTRGRGRDLAFILLDKGFDVWIANQRGTVFNEYHLQYSRTDPRFWKFSFHEVGYYDLPAQIDTVLDVRKKDQLYFIGHSLGTTQFLVMGSTRPQYNRKIIASVLMSPVAYTPGIEELTPAVRILEETLNYYYSVFEATGVHELYPRTDRRISLTRELCVNNNRTRIICLDVVSLISGENRINLNQEEWEFFVPYFGAGSSTRTIYHISQLYLTGEFKQIDLGALRNFRRYGSNRPPRYNLTLVTAPVALIWGHNDVLTSETAVERIASELPNLIYSKAVPDPKFTHIDMYLGDNANEVLHPYIIDLLIKFRGGEYPKNELVHHSSNEKQSYSTGKYDSHSYTTENPHDPHSLVKKEHYSAMKDVSHLHNKGIRDSYDKGEHNGNIKEELLANVEKEPDSDEEEEPCPCNEEEQETSTKAISQSDTKKGLGSNNEEKAKSDSKV